MILPARIFQNPVMTKTLSNTAIIYAILSINSEIALQKDYLNSPEVDESNLKNEMDILTDMEQALAEFIDFYKIRCTRDVKLPDIDELLNTSL